MTIPRSTTPMALVAALLMLGPSVGAEPPEDGRHLSTAAEPLLALEDHGPRVSGERPLAIERVAGVRGTRPSAHEATLARTAFSRRLDLFAERQRFEMAEGSALYGFEGGAALRLREDFDLTARYRLLGHSSLPDDLDAEFSAPLLGVALRF